MTTWWQNIRRLWLRPTSIYQATVADVGDPAGMIVRSWLACERADDAVAEFQSWLAQRLEEFDSTEGEA